MTRPLLSFAKPVFVLLLGFTLFAPNILLAHCDTFAGPVLIEAQKALETGKVAPLLKWVGANQEETIKKAFDVALKNRIADRKKADDTFFEVLIRIHREGEGAPFDGIKPTETALPPAIVAADKALVSGSSKELVDLLTEELVQKIQAKYNHALEKKKSADNSVAEGREYVEAYIEYVHYVEAVSELLAEENGHHHESEGAKTEPGKCSSCNGHE
ncbi:MAG: hypothetical protein ACD_39C01893G0002 [uncultured bacterium]|nr:MAG: hypothetical protein ACD_39C01893G0002 [uncultured bacterium]